MKNLNVKMAWALLALVGITFYACEKDESNHTDIINPYVVSYNPVAGVEEISFTSNLVLTFDNIIEKGTGNITLTTDVEQGTQVIDVNSENVTIGNTGKVLTINPADLMTGREYEIALDKGFVKDVAGNIFGGTPEGESWKFKVGGEPADLDAPEIDVLYPATGATDAPVTTMTLTFNENVKTSTGNFVIFDTSNNVVAEVNAEGENVKVDGKQIIIRLPDGLDFSAAYYINVNEGVVKDAAGNDFAGIKDNTTWNFTTTAGSGSELTVHIPFDGSFADISGNKFDAYMGPTALIDAEFVTDTERGEVINFLAGSYAVLPKHDLLRPSASQDFSINLWVKLSGTDSDPAFFGNSNWGSGGNPGILLCTDNGHEYEPGNGTDDGWIVNLAGDPKADGNRMDWKAAGTDPQAPSMSDNEWHMVTVVLDQANKNLHVYLDGVEYRKEGDPSFHDLSTLTGPMFDVAKDYPFTLWEDGTGKYNVGHDHRGNLTGFMDDLRIYNKALTGEEVTQLFNN